MQRFAAYTVSKERFHVVKRCFREIGKTSNRVFIAVVNREFVYDEKHYDARDFVLITRSVNDGRGKAN